MREKIREYVLNDNGTFPNSKLPLLHYLQVLEFSMLGVVSRLRPREMGSLLSPEQDQSSPITYSLNRMASCTALPIVLLKYTNAGLPLFSCSLTDAA